MKLPQFIQISETLSESTRLWDELGHLPLVWRKYADYVDDYETFKVEIDSAYDLYCDWIEGQKVGITFSGGKGHPVARHLLEDCISRRMEPSEHHLREVRNGALMILGYEKVLSYHQYNRWKILTTVIPSD